MEQAFAKLPTLHPRYFPALLQWFKRHWLYIPHSLLEASLLDISLYDHSKVTCAIATALFDAFKERNVTDYQAVYMDEQKEYFAENLFLLTTIDMSGIQDFIYSISGTNALKSLRTRSFYLELMLEGIVDEVLTKLNLSRANLLYTGGGHAYLLLPHTERVKEVLHDVHGELRRWLLQEFTTDISTSIAYVPCSSNDLMNENGNYHNVWQQLTSKLEQKKLQKYSLEEIRKLNEPHYEAERECKECLRSDVELTDGCCSLCSQIIKTSNKLRDYDYFVIHRGKGDLKLPFDTSLTMAQKESVIEKWSKENVNIYSKNREEIALNETITANLAMCDYDYASSDVRMRPYGIGSYAKFRKAGIHRLGVMRADVDNLGTVFISGIPEEYVSISRTATLSRQLSLFFKVELTNILQGSQITVIYSGGDDIFLIGAWDEVVEKAVEIRKAFERFTLNKLSFSAGIGIFREKFPVEKM